MIQDARPVFRVYWKSRTAPKGVTECVGFVKAQDIKDARRIAEETFDTRVIKVTNVTPAKMHMITPQSITINFGNYTTYDIF